MTYEILRDTISAGGIDAALRTGLAVPEERIPAERERYAAALAAFGELYGTEGEISLYSVGGRSEISGNHTDHNHGRVIAASVNLDILAFARPTDDGVVSVKSAGFPEDIVSPAAIDAPDPDRFFSPPSSPGCRRRSARRATRSAASGRTPPPTSSRAPACPLPRRLRS